jgi:hypothetical protein
MLLSAQTCYQESADQRTRNFAVRGLTPGMTSSNDTRLSCNWLMLRRLRRKERKTAFPLQTPRLLRARSSRPTRLTTAWGGMSSARCRQSAKGPHRHCSPARIETPGVAPQSDRVVDWVRPDGKDRCHIHGISRYRSIRVPRDIPGMRQIPIAIPMARDNHPGAAARPVPGRPRLCRRAWRKQDAGRHRERWKHRRLQCADHDKTSQNVAIIRFGPVHDSGFAVRPLTGCTAPEVSSRLASPWCGSTVPKGLS